MVDFYKHKFSDKFIYLDRPELSQPKISSARSANHEDENEEHHFIPTAPSSHIQIRIQKTSPPKTIPSTSNIHKASTEKQSTSSLGHPGERVTDRTLRFEDNLPHEKRHVPHEEDHVSVEVDYATHEKDRVPHVEVRVPRMEDHLHRAENEVSYSANSMVHFSFLSSQLQGTLLF